jgi:hypothetical protein
MAEKKIKAYYGTSFGTAIEIAKTGAILSPWEHQISLLDTVSSNHPDMLEDLLSYYKLSPHEKEELALKMASEAYGEYETEDRVKCVQLAKNINDAFSQATQYHRQGGIMLEFEVPKKYGLHNNNIFIPRKQSLDSLKKVVFLLKNTHEIDKILHSYSVYDPDFFRIDAN